MPENQSTDIELWNAFKNKDKNAFDLLFKLFYPSLFLYGFKITRDRALLEDAIQELFLELWTTTAKSKVRSVKAYLFRALQYKLIKKLNDNKLTRYPADDNFQYNFEVSHETLLVAQQTTEEDRNRIINFMARLSARQREIIYLRFYRNMPYEDISEIMGINYQASRNLLSQSVKALRELMTSAAGVIRCFI